MSKKKKTALEQAQQQQIAVKPINWMRLASTAGFALALVIAAVAGLQAQAVWLEQTSETQLASSRIELAGSAKALIKRQQRELQNAINAPEFVALLNSEDAGGKLEAVESLRKKFAEIKRVELYRPDLQDMLNTNLAEFGYAKAESLLDAKQNKGSATPHAYWIEKDETWEMAFVESVYIEQEIFALVFVTRDMQQLNGLVKQAKVGQGQLFVRLASRWGSGSKIVGIEGGEFGLHQSVQAVDGTRFEVVTVAPDLFKIGDIVGLVNSRSLAYLISLAVIALIALTAVVLWRTGIIRVIGKQRKVEDEPTLKHLLSQSENEVKTMPAKPVANLEIEAEGAQKQNIGGPGSVDRSIFRAYDIRGIVGASLTKQTARLIGQAIGSEAIERKLDTICVGRDGRLSGPDLSEELMHGLRAAGCNVIDVGAVPTPVLYFATYHLKVGSGVMVTGSHNPPDYNGFKIVLGGETLSGEAIVDLFARIVEGRLVHGNGTREAVDVRDDYVQRIAADIQVSRPLRIVVDAGNGIGGEIGPAVLGAIGCEVEPLYCEIDGTFPNHHPDPSDPRNLDDLIMVVKKLGADFGIAFDGDADRLGMVTGSGEIIYPDRLLMLFAQDVLSRNPGAAIIYDVKCTRHLSSMVLRHGGSPMMWKTGHSFIKSKMREEGAALAGEMSGHFFFQERWFGFDDGIYAAARLCEILAISGMSADEVLADIPKDFSTPELKIAMVEGEHYDFMEVFSQKSVFPGANLTKIDGVRADFKDGWGLVRCSNTTPSLVLRFEAESEVALERIQSQFREQLLAQNSKLELPF